MIYQEVSRVLEALRKKLQDVFAVVEYPDHIDALESLVLGKRLSMRVVFNSGIRAALFLTMRAAGSGEGAGDGYCGSGDGLGSESALRVSHG